MLSYHVKRCCHQKCFYAILAEMQKTDFDVIIAGGGASGVSCGALCARAGQKTLVLEAQSKPLRKLLASGNGRCNITNTRVSHACYYGDPAFIHTIITRFGLKNCIEFLNSIGVVLKEEKDGRVFPAAGSAPAVEEALLLALSEAGGELKTNCEVKKISAESPFRVETAGGVFTARNVVLACGGAAYKKLGGSASGYNLARALGHTITPVSPAMAGLKLKEPGLKFLDGTRTDAALTLLSENNAARAEGEIIFSSSGVSGNPVLTLSRIAARAQKKCFLEIDFAPLISARALLKDLKDRASRSPDRKIAKLLTGLVSENIARAALEKAAIPPTVLAGKADAQTLQNLAALLKTRRFEIEAVQPLEECFAAAGGADVKEVDARSMMSKKVKNLFITGELLDVDGHCGGFNLHFALACAHAAARTICGGIKNG